MDEKFLPIGSICTIKASNRKVMIMGYFALDYAEKVKLYDYKGCVYPEGTLGATRICFNHSDILSIEYMGYVDSNFTLFNRRLNNQQVDKVINNDTIFANFEFDENGVVVFAQPSVETKKEESVVQSTISANKQSNINNPFYKAMVYEPTVVEEKKPDEETKDWPIFNNIQFDENGVVVSAE